MTDRPRASDPRPSDTEDAARHTPLLSGLLAWSAAVPPLALAVGSIALRDAPREAAERAHLGWAAALLCFFGGVRRGLSFRQSGGARFGEIATTLLLFGTGAGGLAVNERRSRAGLLAAGFAAATLLDRRAARRQEAPRYFGRLRAAQFPLIAATLLVPLMRRARR